MEVTFHYQQALCQCSVEGEYKENQTMVHLHIAGCPLGLCMEHAKELHVRLSEILRKIEVLDNEPSTTSTT